MRFTGCFSGLCVFTFEGAREMNCFDSSRLPLTTAAIAHHSPKPIHWPCEISVWDFAGKQPKYRNKLQMLFDQMASHWLGNPAPNAGKWINLPVIELLMWSNASKQGWPNTSRASSTSSLVWPVPGEWLNALNFALWRFLLLLAGFLLCLSPGPSSGLLWLRAGTAAWQWIPSVASPHQGQASLHLKTPQGAVGDGDLHHPFNPVVPL